MNKLLFLIAVFACGTALVTESPAQTDEAAVRLFSWGLLWTGSWEENAKSFDDFSDLTFSGTLHNRGEIQLHFLPLGLLLRGQILDRRPVSLVFENLHIQSEPEKTLTNITGGLYHRPTGSRLLLGVIDEWGLPARIRSPWIRSPPYPENHRPIMADLRTGVSATREDEAYLYLSSPFLEITNNIKTKGFFSAQTQINSFIDMAPFKPIKPAFCGGADFRFTGKSSSSSHRLLLEAFYTQFILPPRKVNTWFSYPPPLPEREFRLYSAGFLFNSPDFSVSSDFALSETLTWGTDIYANMGVSVTPLLPFGSRVRPLAISFAADGAGERYVNRDGANYSAGFRGAGKIEWRGRHNYLMRVDSVLRSPGLNEDFNRSSTGFYCRFPSLPANRAANNTGMPIRLTRISISADRNASNPDKITDSFSGSIGLSLNLQSRSPLGMAFSGSVKGIASSEGNTSVFPIPNGEWEWETAGINCEFFWSPRNFQFRARAGLSIYDEKDEKWDILLSTTIRFRQGRVTFRVMSPDFPEKWSWAVSWRYEIQEKR
jgi:hypothetical protein